MSLLERGDNAYLLLADGTIFEGLHFGVKGTAIGEVVFTTGMTAYQETLTDPSYYGQLVTQTFPLIGNYGVNAADSESARSYIHGYIVREWCNTPSNFRMEGDIDGFLKEQNIVGIYNIDTRKLTRIIREVGVMNGVITTEDVYAKKEELLEQVRDEDGQHEDDQALENGALHQVYVHRKWGSFCGLGHAVPPIRPENDPLRLGQRGPF